MLTTDIGNTDTGVELDLIFDKYSCTSFQAVHGS